VGFEFFDCLFVLGDEGLKRWWHKGWKMGEKCGQVRENWCAMHVTKRFWWFTGGYDKSWNWL
jgi:hypothetical protein